MTAAERLGMSQYFFVRLDEFTAHREHYEGFKFQTAAQAVDVALSKTMEYMREEQAGRRPLATKEELSSLWQAASRAVAPLDSVFSEACYYKALGWLTPEDWVRANERGIKTDLEFIKGERIKLIKSAKVQLSSTKMGGIDALRSYFDAVMSSDNSHEGKSSNSDHLVILVHGFNTRAHWMNDVKPALQRHGFSVGATSFGDFGFVRFLSFPVCRQLAKERVLKGIRTAERIYKDDNAGNAPKKTSVIAHSFGSWLFMRILRENPGLKFYRIIFCGSILPEDYDFDPVLHQFSRPLLNHIGTRDYWPAVGESAGWGYGSIGSNSLNDPAAENRWHKDFHHSDFLRGDFCDEFWVPFLEGQAPRAADRWQMLPLWVRVATFFPLRWIILSIAIVAPLLLGQFLSLKLLGVDAVGEIREFIQSRLVRAAVPPPPMPPSRPVNGVWDVVITCPQRQNLQEYGASFNGGRYGRKFKTDTTTGITELALGYLTDDTVKLTGYVVFGQTDVYTVEAIATKHGNSFSGNGQYGQSANCSVNITATN